MKYDFMNDRRFDGIQPFEKKIWLSSPTMHGNEQRWVEEAIRTNWVSTVGENINVIEEQIAEYIECKYAVQYTDIKFSSFQLKSISSVSGRVLIKDSVIMRSVNIRCRIHL